VSSKVLLHCGISFRLESAQGLDPNGMVNNALMLLSLFWFAVQPIARGNQICRRFGGGTATIEGSLENCPIGTYSWVDSWGNRICKSFGGGTQYYDTSSGCPVGTYGWIDTWGNEVCKRFYSTSRPE